MNSNEKDPLFALFYPPENILGDFVEHIANGPGLTRYKTIIQHGNKNGQPLYAHVIDLVFTLDRLAEPLRLTAIEERVLMLALSIHDFNKIVGDGRFPDITAPENVIPELERIGADQFFPDWREYLDDIIILIRAHSGHYFHSGTLLMMTDPYGLGRERILELAELVTALDVIDLAHSMDDRKPMRTFRDKINEISDTSYELVHHVVAEQRGVLTNAIHNRIAEFMYERKSAYPLLYYPDGVVYLVERARSLSITDDDYRDIAAKVTAFYEGLTRKNFRDFIKATNQGVKVAPKCLELGMSFSQIWQAIDGIISRKRYNFADMEEKARNRALKTLGDEKGDAANRAYELLNSERILPKTDETMRLGELIRSYYIFLSAHFKSVIPDPWARIYPLIEMAVEDQPFYDYFDKNYDRAYVIAPHLKLGYDEVYKRLEEDGAALLGDEAIDSPWSPVFEAYIRTNVQFSFQKPGRAELAGYLQQYVQHNHAQSAYGGSLFESEEWMAGDAPKSIKVQQFSNRLRGGPGAPKKRIDPISKAQFLLEKLNYAPATRKVSTFYLHIYPYSFFSPAYLDMWRYTVRSWVEQNISAIFLKSDDMLRDIFDGNPMTQLHASKANSNGLPLPGASEMLGNVLIWPLNAPGVNNTERYWYAFTCAVSLQRYISARVVLTRSAVPIVASNEFDDLLLDEIPLGLEGLLAQNSYTYRELENLIEKLNALYGIRGQVYNRNSKTNELLVLVRSLLDGPLGVYFAAERLLERKLAASKTVKSPEWSAIYSSHVINRSLQFMAQLTGGENVIKTIQTLAKLAWEGRLRGESLKKNSLMMPLDQCFEKVQMKEDPLDDGVLRAATIEDIYAYLERIRDEGMVGQATRVKAAAFVDTFFDELLGKDYKGNRQRLLNDEKLIRSAFLFHVRDLIGERAAEKKAKTTNSSGA